LRTAQWAKLFDIFRHAHGYAVNIGNLAAAKFEGIRTTGTSLLEGARGVACARQREDHSQPDACGLEANQKSFHLLSGMSLWT
jgi:hypothetical protein